MNTARLLCWREERQMISAQATAELVEKSGQGQRGWGRLPRGHRCSPAVFFNLLPHIFLREGEGCFSPLELYRPGRPGLLTSPQSHKWC